MSSGFIIRLLHFDDYENLSKFFIENNKPEITNCFNPFPLSDEIAYKISCMKTKDFYYIVLYEYNIIGLGMLRGWDEGFTVPSLGVIIDYRYHNLGIGKKLVKFLISKAKERNCESIILSVYVSNIKAIELYRSLGFKNIKTQELIVNGRKDSKVIMMKKI